MDKAPRSPRTVPLIVGAILVLALGILIGGHPSWLPGPLRSVFVDRSDSVMAEALDALSKGYYRPLSPQVLQNAGVQGAVGGLHDPYSHYFSPSDYRSFLNTTSPHLSGIGISVERDPQGLRIVEVYPGSPAAHAGLAGGEVIVQVGSTSLAGRSENLGPRMIKGPAGSTVQLTVSTRGVRRVVRIKRANLTIPVASSSLVTVGGRKVGLVRLSTFSDGSGAEVHSQVKSLLRQGARGLVLDLRANGGGLLDEAVNVASIFISDGTLVSTEGRSQPRQVYVAKGGAISAKIPVAVLVDRGTASSAEIVAGALQDRRRAKVVGTRTYGKGVFQEIQTLSNGGALEIVTGRWFEPSGRNVGGPGVSAGGGIRPDVLASTNPRGTRDTALDAAERTVAAEIS